MSALAEPIATEKGAAPETKAADDSKTMSRKDKQKLYRENDKAQINSDGNISGSLYKNGRFVKATIKKRYFELVGDKLYSYKSKKKFDEKGDDLSKQKSELIVGLQSATRCLLDDKLQMVPIHLVFIVDEENKKTKKIKQKKVSKVLYVRYQMVGRGDENDAAGAEADAEAELWTIAFNKLVDPDAAAKVKAEASDAVKADAKAHYAKGKGRGRGKKKQRPSLADSLAGKGFSEAMDETRKMRGFKRQQTELNLLTSIKDEEPVLIRKRSFKRQETADGKEYFSNVETNETVWTMPEDGILESAALIAAGVYFKRYENPEGKEYFVNTVTQATVWTLPEGGVLESAAAGLKFKSYKTPEGKEYFVNTVTQATVWALPEGGVVE